MVVITVIIFKKGGTLHTLWGNPEAVRHPHPIPHLQLESIPPLLQVDRARDGGAIVGDVSLQCTVEEEVIILT